MANDDTLVGLLWRSNRQRTRFLIIAFLILFSSSLLFSREYASFQEWHPSFSHNVPEAQLRVDAPSISTVTVTALPHVETQVVTVSKTSDPVIFSLIMWSKDSAVEGALLIKTILMYTSSPTEFHIICDQEARDFLQGRFSLLTSPLHPVKVRFYQPSLQSMIDRVNREGSIHSDHASGIPGLMKLFIHEILPASVKKSIYVDTDAIFISDPTLLWNLPLKPTTAVSMSYHPDENSPMWHNASKICSCVMVLDLEKLRQVRLMDSIIYHEAEDDANPSALSPPAFRAMYGEPGPTGYVNVKLGDQGYWWAIVEHRPDIFEPLSFDFEVTSCLMDTYSISLGDDGRHEADELSRQSHTKGTLQEGILIRPKLLHFNCLHGVNVYMDWEGWSNPKEGVTKRWGPALFYHHGYKWIWLNQGSTELVDIQALHNFEFADLQFARDHAILA
ncbi:glycosyltransferase family 8 protein [Collybiopsis luxurians FD-317 M1]|uniref:Glycosyltransferase family 8 protein n=1 Tax=Collybiopsis luxurians FD-317 M1 TaxID=944289 RepID=A0A0D0CVS6_9AGAR|nr:glycosyltransferase family 8 protein [Collybiopsis luxurians FD-317 M1]